jgi:hypothetical protein
MVISLLVGECVNAPASISFRTKIAEGQAAPEMAQSCPAAQPGKLRLRVLLGPPFASISMLEADMPHNPKTHNSAARPDETPATFAELKPPGYWSATLGYFVPVRCVSDEEFWRRSLPGLAGAETH